MSGSHLRLLVRRNYYIQSCILYYLDGELTSGGLDPGISHPHLCNHGMLDSGLYFRFQGVYIIKIERATFKQRSF